MRGGTASCSEILEIKALAVRFTSESEKISRTCLRLNPGLEAVMPLFSEQFPIPPGKIEHTTDAFLIVHNTQAHFKGAL